MACPHPAVFMERITSINGVPGIRCQSCGATGFKGESFWTLIKRNVLKVKTDAP